MQLNVIMQMATVEYIKLVCVSKQHDFTHVHELVKLQNYITRMI